MRKAVNLFPDDSYTTPATNRRGLRDRLLGNTRFYFFFSVFWTFIQTGVCAKRGKLNDERQIHYSNKNARLIERCGGTLNISGLDNIAKAEGKAVVFLGNHMSLLETAVFHAILRPRCDFTFVIKESLLKVPFFGNIMRSLKAIPVSRTNPKEDFRQVLKLGKESLNSGCSIILFPQSTRTLDFSAENFNSIGIKLAKSADAMVIPFALKTDFIGNGRLVRDMGPINRDRPVCFAFGEPFQIEGNGKEEQQRVISFIQEHIERWNSAEQG